MTTERHEARIRLMASMLVSAIGLPLISFSVISIPVVATVRSLFGASLLQTSAVSLVAATIAVLGAAATFAGVRLKVIPFRMMTLRRRYLRLGARTTVVVFVVYALLALAAHRGCILGLAQMHFARILLTAGALLAVTVATGGLRLSRLHEELLAAHEADANPCKEPQSRDDRAADELRRLVIRR
jgi:hypothetical protein